MFQIEAAEKALRKFLEYDALEIDEGSVLVLIRFDATITDCILSFEISLLMSESYIAPKTGHFKPEIDVRTNKIWVHKGGFILQESSNGL